MIILEKYLDYLKVFSKKTTLMLLEQTKFNQYAIKLKKSKELFYKSIYCLGPIKLEI